VCPHALLDAACRRGAAPARRRFQVVRLPTRASAFDAPSGAPSKADTLRAGPPSEGAGIRVACALLTTEGALRRAERRGISMTTRGLLPLLAMLVGAMAMAGCKVPEPPPDDDGPSSEQPAAQPGEAPPRDDAPPERRARRWPRRGHGHRPWGRGARGPWQGPGGDGPGAPPWGRWRDRGGDNPGQGGPPPGWHDRWGGGRGPGGPGGRWRDGNDDPGEGPREAPDMM
jgi:hypothetical protein